jgi:hypothetical protein
MQSTSCAASDVSLVLPGVRHTACCRVCRGVKFGRHAEDVLCPKIAPGRESSQRKDGVIYLPSIFALLFLHLQLAISLQPRHPALERVGQLSHQHLAHLKPHKSDVNYYPQ